MYHASSIVFYPDQQNLLVWIKKIRIKVSLDVKMHQINAFLDFRPSLSCTPVEQAMFPARNAIDAHAQDFMVNDCYYSSCWNSHSTLAHYMLPEMD